MSPEKNLQQRPAINLDGIEWIWFDLDDTIYDFKTSSLIGLHEIYKRYGLDRFFPDEDSWIDIYHRHNAALWDLYSKGLTDQPTLRHQRFFLPLTEGGADRSTAEKLTAIFDNEYLDLLGSTGLLVDGARATLESLHAAGYKIGILSNGFTGVQNLKLDSSNIRPLIDCMALSDEIDINKPDRRLFDYALAKAGASAGASIMVGDNPDTDIAGALNASWRAILFKPGATETTIAVNDTAVPVIADLRALIYNNE